MERLLSPIERVIYHLDRTSSSNVTIIARLRGPLGEAALRAALGAARARHPYLRARITLDGAGRPMLREEGAPPSLRLVSGPGADWIGEVEREVNEPLPAESGPLLRAVLVEHAAEDHSLLITFHHSIGDGQSGVYLVRDLVMAAAAAMNGERPALAPLGDTRPIDERLPASARGWSGRLRWARFFLREAGNAMRYETPRTLRRDREVFAHERRARLIHEVLDEELSARLTARARAEGTTVHGALSAAILLGGVRDLAARGRVRVAFGSPVNLRGALDPPVGEDLGFYISMLAYVAEVSAGDDLWELARRVRASLGASVASGRAYTVLAALVTTFRALGGLRLEPRALAERWERALPATAALTNLGRLDIATRFGALEIEALHFLGAPGALGDFFSGATSLHGRIFWNFVWTDPVYEAGHARALVDDIVAGLQRAIDEPAASG